MPIEKYPYRSHCSDISNEQLILFDFLFDIRAPIDILKEDVFSSHLNVPYSHGFSNLELTTTLNKLVANGWLFIQQKVHYSGKTSRYGLTEKGGDIWADERKPIWDLYIEYSVGRQVSTDRSIACLRAYSLDVLNEYLNFCIDSKFLGTLLSEPKYNFDYREQIYWKGLERTHEYTFEVEEESEFSNWNSYEFKRVWWIDVSELQKYV